MKKSLNEEVGRIQELLNEFVVFAGDYSDKFLTRVLSLGQQQLVSSGKVPNVYIHNLLQKLNTTGVKSLDQNDMGLVKQLVASIPNIVQTIITEFGDEFKTVPKEKWGSYFGKILDKFENILPPQQIIQIQAALTSGGQPQNTETAQNQGGVGNPSHPNLLNP
jgi:hypothetical protein